MTGDGQASFGQQPYEPGRCRCGDLVTLHVINGKGQRAACSDPLCTCARFVAAEAVSEGA
jgi:hypothetical protein